MTIEAALDLAAAGLPIFPCGRDKRPLVSHWRQDATTDAGRIREWWRAHPEAMIGLPTGQASGLYVVDLDIAKETGEALGENTLAALGLSYLLDGARVNTPSGGVHLFFRWPGEGFGNTAKRLGPGIDTRGDGGFVIAAGSRNGLGEYIAQGDWQNPPELPEALRDLLTRPPQEAHPAQEARHAPATSWGEVALREELARVLAAPEGTRNDALNRAAFRLAQVVAGGNLDGATVTARLAGAAAAIGLPAQEAQRTIESGMAAGMASPRGPEPRPGGPVVLTGGTPEWPEADLRFLNPALPEPPALPLAEVLTPRAAEWVAATAEGAGAPADYVLLALFSVVGSLVGNSRWVSPWQGWYEPPLVWGMAVGNPSAGKSPAIDAVLAPLRRAERPLREAAEAEFREWVKRSDIAAVAKRAWERRCETALKDGKAAPPMPPEADAGTAPHIPRLVVNDGTVERLGVIAKEQPKGFLQMRDELAGWLLSMEARNGGSDRAFWLEAYGGRAFTVERMGRPPLTVARLTIGALGGIQPDRLNELLLKSRDDGLLARFLPVWPHRVPPKQPERFADDTLADAAFTRLAGLEMPLAEDGEPRPWFVGFDDAARGLMNEWRKVCADWESEAEGLLLSFIGKLPGMAARLSLVLAAIGYAFDDEPEPAQRRITAAEFGRACHYLESYALPMARRCYGAASLPAPDMAARRLVALIREEHWRTFTAREVQRRGRQGLADAKAVSAALARLAEADLVAEVAQPPGPQGGRPARLYAVNPVVHEAQP